MKFTNKQPLIVVVGSASIDFVLETTTIPKANDTILVSESKSFLGGKGANQAIGTARLGANVYLVSRVGMDPFGQQVMRNLSDEGVNVGFVSESMEPTGSAYVTTSNEGNAIVVIPGANSRLLPKHIDQADRYIQTADLILTQLEIPVNTVEYLVEKCKKYKKQLGIYAAPATELPKSVMDYASFIVAKSQSFKSIFGEQPAEDVMKNLPNKLFLRDDVNSTSYFDGKEMKYYRDNPAIIVNKMGMGDAFTSGFSIGFVHANNTEDCVKFGNKIAYNVAGELDSQKGLPFLKDVR